jgi:hypothetical protein
MDVCSIPQTGQTIAPGQKDAFRVWAKSIKKGKSKAGAIEEIIR